MAVFLFILSVLILTLGVFGQLEAPQNAIATVGSTVTLKCKFNVVGCSGITWQILHSLGSSLIYRYDIGLAYPFNQMGRYSVNNSSGCYLTITGITMTDAGRYGCQEVNTGGQIDANAYLIVIDNDLPTCKTNANKDFTMENDFVTFSCNLKYNGTHGSMVNWKGMEGNQPFNTSNQTINYAVVALARAPIVPSYECVIKFSLLKLDKYAKNELSTSCKTDEVLVLYPVRHISLSPSFSTYSPGTTVTCSAEGNPSPNYEWQVFPSESQGPWKTEVRGAILQAGNASLNLYRCVARNIVKGSNFKVISDVIKINYTLSSDGITEFQLGSVVGIAVAVAAGVVVIMIFIIIFCFCCRTCPGYKSRHKKHKLKVDNNRDAQPLTEKPSNASLESRTNQVKARPPPPGDPPRGKRPPMEPPPPEPPQPRQPQAKPRTTVKNQPADNRHNGPEYEQGVVYAMLDSDKTPHKLQLNPNAGEESEYADISRA